MIDKDGEERGKGKENDGKKEKERSDEEHKRNCFALSFPPPPSPSFLFDCCQMIIFPPSSAAFCLSFFLSFLFQVRSCWSSDNHSFPFVRTCVSSRVRVTTGLFPFDFLDRPPARPFFLLPHRPPRSYRMTSPLWSSSSSSSPFFFTLLFAVFFNRTLFPYLPDRKRLTRLR